MKINYFLLALALLTSFAVSAQTTYTLADTVVAKRYSEEAKVLATAANYDAALEKLDSAGAIYEQVVGNESKEYATILNRKGICNQQKGEYERAIELHQKALEIRLKVLGPRHSDVAGSYYNIGLLFYSKGDYDQADEFYKKSLEIKFKAFGRNHPEVANSYNNIGVVAEIKGDYERAAMCYHEALNIRLKSLDPTHPDISISYNNLGNIYRLKSDFQQAFEFYQKALEIRLKTHGMKHPDIANSYNGLGSVYFSKGDYDQSLEYYRRALEILENGSQQNQLRMAMSYHNFGTVYEKKGNYDLAIDYLKKALETRLKILGPENPEVASSYHNLGSVYHSKGDLDQAGKYYEKALDIRQKIFGIENVNTAASFSGLGLVFSSKGDYEKAKEFLQKALKIMLETLGPEHLDVAMLYTNLGLVYLGKGEYDEADEILQKALEIRLKVFGPKHVRIAESFNNLGLLYRAKGDYSRGRKFFKKALEIHLNEIGPEHRDAAGSFENLGLVHQDFGDYDHAIEFYDKALNIRLKTLGYEHSDVARSYNNLGVAYHLKGDFNRAIEFHQKALNIRQKVFSQEYVDVAESANNLGVVYQSKGDLAQADTFFQKALYIRSNLYGPEHPNVAIYFNNLGIICLLKGSYANAEDFFHKALEIKTKTFGMEHPSLSIPLINLLNTYRKQKKFVQGESVIQQTLKALRYTGQNSYKQVNSIPFLLEALSAKAYFYKDFYTTTSQKQEYLITARQSFSEAITIITYQRKTLENPSSKSTLSKESAGVYEGGISTNLLLHQITDSLHFLHEAFQYAEQSKALSLYESMKNAEALRFAGIPDSLLQQEYDLRVDIAYNEKRRQDEFAKGKEETDSTVLKISSKLFDLKRADEQLIDTFEIRYPDYFRLKYDFRTEDIVRIQRDLLQPDQAMLEYFVGDSSIFIFLVKKDDYRIVEVKKDFRLEEWVQQLRHGIYGYRMDSLQHDTLPAFAASEYTGAAWQLYQKLLAPVDSLLPRRVVIVPDGVLGYVPFEALLTQKPAMPHRFQTHPYFFKQHDLSYCYSATLLREMKGRQHRQKPSLNVTGFAPFFHGEMAFQEGTRNRGGGWDTLPQSGQEVYRIVEMMGGQSFLGKEASKEAFLRMAGQGRILHLATHGKSDDQSGDRSFLVFSDDTLYVREIYNLSLNADLVTLSACETGIGELQRGEGIISLARAFSYAGAKSIVTTLWSVDDAPTKDLMVAFYQNLKDGMTKDKALTEVKRGFLKTRYAHPFYWAGFVGIGDMGEVGSGQ